MAEVYRQHVVQEAVDKAQQALAADMARVHVDGVASSGRSSVCRELAGADALEVLAPQHPDMVGDALLQVMSLVRATEQPTGTLSDRLKWMQQVLSKRGKRVVVRLHASWADSFQDPDQSGFRARAATWLHALCSPETRVSVVLVGGLGVSVGTTTRIRLDLPFVEWAEFEDRVKWLSRNYASAAFTLRKRGSSYPQTSPIVARLAVGRVALGDDIDRVERDLANNGLRARPHVDALVGLAAAHERHSELIEALTRVSRLRRPLPRPQAAVAAGLPADDPDLDLVASCVGYTQQDTCVRWSEPVSRSLWAAFSRSFAPVDPDANDRRHRDLADAWRQVDGVHEPQHTDGLADLRHWAEKVHHLARSGDLGAKEWGDQDIRQSEQLWDRARALSRRGRYRQAVDLYERCIGWDPEDAYAWHYIGFNLDKLGEDRQSADDAFHRAIQLDPDNPWWNGRRITWLIGQGRYADAESAWNVALNHIDPSGTRADSWLAQHFYRHVIRAWLDVGELTRARAALEAVPDALRPDPTLRHLEAVLVDFEEAWELQGSVRPLGLLAEARWIPRALPDTAAGSPRTRWYAGRIVAVGDDGVQIRAATSTRSSSGSRRVLAYTSTWDEWEAWGGSTLRDELSDRFVELGEYGDEPNTKVLVRLLDRVDRPESSAPGRSWVNAWRDR